MYEPRRFKCKEKFAEYGEFEEAAARHLRENVRGLTVRRARECEFSCEVLEFVSGDGVMRLTLRDDLGDVYCYIARLRSRETRAESREGATA